MNTDTRLGIRFNMDAPPTLEATFVLLARVVEHLVNLGAIAPEDAASMWQEVGGAVDVEEIPVA